GDVPTRSVGTINHPSGRAPLLRLLTVTAISACPDSRFMAARTVDLSLTKSTSATTAATNITPMTTATTTPRFSSLSIIKMPRILFMDRHGPVSSLKRTPAALGDKVKIEIECSGHGAAEYIRQLHNG